MHRELRRSTMKRHPATTLWLASVVLLAVMATSGYAQDFPSCPRNCSCAREDRDEFEVTCPSDGERIALKLQPRSKAVFLCQVNTVSDDFTLLKDVSVDAGSAMEFRLCPLPDVAFTDILRLRNAAKIQAFTYSSYRKFNDTLERRLFRGLTGVTSLSLANNGLTSLPADLLMDMPHLQQISFLNNLVQLPADLFQPVLNLKTIELGKNELSVIPTDLFRNLKKLDLLNIWKNKLTNLSPEMFRDLTSLTSLDLRHNGLTSLPADVFKYLTSLKNLRLDGNEFQTLPTGLFRTNKGLETVHLSDSRKPNLKLPSGLFANLPNLTSVDFNNAGLRELPNDLFWGSHKITSISIKNNLLKEIPTELFQNGTDLEKINLSFNHLNSLQEYVFQSCRKLKSLDVSYNKMTNLSRNALSGLDALEELYLENNMLSYIDKDTFRSNSKLKILNMANNKLSFDYLIAASKSLFEDVSPLYKCEGLEKIDLSNNSISYIFSDWKNFFPNLTMLNMSHNALESISFYSDAFSPHRNREIDVSHNKISVFDLGEQSETWARENAQVANSDKRQTWLLHGNPFSCNCSNYPFFRYLEKQLAPELQQLVNIVPGNLACAEPDSWQSTPVVEVKSKAITCPLALSAASICPRPCSCALRVADTALIIDCIGKNLTEAPAALPMSPSSNHTELYLTHNKLEKLPDFTQPGYEMVSRLALGSNNITRIHNVTNLPKILQVIELHRNNLTVIEEETMDAFSNLPNLTTITLHDNPWKCDCHLQPLISFVQVNFRKIINPDKMKCLNGQLLSAQTVSGLCSQTSSVVWASLVVALLLGALIGASFAVYYKYAREIKAWLFAHNMCLWFVTEEELDKDKLYDAFVSYSHKDEDFILNELVPNLEGGPIPFKLCLHYRDWVAGEWIPNQITRSVEDSRRTLVVLSPNFLESVWGRMEFRAAHCQALNEGRARVIVVLLGDIGPMDDLDPELRAYLNMNTYVKWGDPWFWKKLRYALPHPPKAMKGSMGLVNRNPKLVNGKSTEDKLELICEPNALPPVTTPPAEGNITDPLCIKNALNEALSSPRKVIIPTNETNGTVAGTAAVG